MNVEFTVLTFDNESTADEALKELRQLQKDKIVKVLNAAVIAKDKQGKASIKGIENVDAKHGALFGAIAGGLIGLVSGALGVIVGALAGAGTGGVAAQLIDLGFPKEYLRALQDNLRPGTSALVTLVEPTWIDRVIKELADLGGQLFRYTLKTELNQL